MGVYVLQTLVLYFKDIIKMAIIRVEFFLHTTLKISSEKQDVKPSPDRAGILPSRSVGTEGQGR